MVKNNNSEVDGSVFERFVGQRVKVIYKDIEEYKVVRGVLNQICGGFLSLDGDMGEIVLAEKTIERVNLVK